MHRRSNRVAPTTRMKTGPRWLALAITLVMMVTTLPIDLAQPAAAQDEERTYTWIVEKRECPPGFDPANVDPGVAFSSCPIASGFPFSLTSNNPNYPGEMRNAGSDGIGLAVWSGLPGNTTYTLAEQIPAGFGNPTLRCAVYADPSNPAAGAANPGFNYVAGGVSVSLPAEGLDGLNTVKCFVYNVPTEAIDPDPSTTDGAQDGENGQADLQTTAAGTISIEKYTCRVARSYTFPSDVDSALDSLSIPTVCQPGPSSSRFSMTLGNNQPQTLSPDQNGVAYYDNYQGGIVKIEEIDINWPHVVNIRVYCSTPASTDGGSYPYELAELDQGRSIWSEPVKANHDQSQLFSIGGRMTA